MKYFIGLQIPKDYKLKVEMFRANFNFFTTQPHITLVEPTALPDDDYFINEIVEICKKTQPFNVNLGQLGQFKKRVLYINVHSTELIKLYEHIYEKLSLVKDNRCFSPHLTVVKQRPKQPIDIDYIKKRAEKQFPASFKFTSNSIVIYQQPKEKSIYIPYMRIPLGL